MALDQIPVRMCVVIPLLGGSHKAYCIACEWSGSPMRTKAAAERSARRHSCRKRGDAVS